MVHESRSSQIVESGAIVEHIETTQLDSLEAAAEICTRSISSDSLVHLFGTGHSHMMGGRREAERRPP